MDWKKTREKINETVTAIAAGMGIKDVREMLRGEPPSKRPNPRFRVHTTSFWFHIRPRWYPKSATKFTYTLGLGWISVFLLIIEGITGLILMIPYTPSPDRAYFDMLNIMGGIPFGDLLRDIHRLANLKRHICGTRHREPFETSHILLPYLAQPCGDSRNASVQLQPKLANWT